MRTRMITAALITLALSMSAGAQTDPQYMTSTGDKRSKDTSFVTLIRRIAQIDAERPELAEIWVKNGIGFGDDDLSTREFIVYLVWVWNNFAQEAIEGRHRVCMAKRNEPPRDAIAHLRGDFGRARRLVITKHYDAARAALSSEVRERLDAWVDDYRTGSWEQVVFSEDGWSFASDEEAAEFLKTVCGGSYGD